MKPTLVILLLCFTLAGCASTARKQAPVTPWNQVENLVGEPLVTALVAQGHFDVAEFNEERRNTRLEIRNLEIRAELAPEKKEELNKLKIEEQNLTDALHRLARDKKMQMWREIYTQEHSAAK